MEYLNIALAKGRLADKAYKIFRTIGINCPEMEKDSRKLIFQNDDLKVRFVLVKASDVPVYVERGATDLGVVGKDTIMEEDRDVYEIADLEFGKCKFSVASVKDFNYQEAGKILKVATKYPNVAKKYFEQEGREIDIIKLHGSVELAPLVGLSDVIVDIVQTGNTLRANGLEVVEDMCEVSARLISNKVSFKFKNNKIRNIVSDIEKLLLGGECIDRD